MSRGVLEKVMAPPGALGGGQWSRDHGAQQPRVAAGDSETSSTVAGQGWVERVERPGGESGLGRGTREWALLPQAEVRALLRKVRP